MRVSSALLLSLALLTFFNRTVIGQQVQPPDAAAVQTSALKIDTPPSLVGCVGVKEANKDRVTLSAVHNGLIYHFFGKGVNGYVVRGVYMIGGFVPTTNVAAQAGSIDPVAAAMEPAVTQLGMGAVHVSVARIALIRPLRGSCPSP